VGCNEKKHSIKEEKLINKENVENRAENNMSEIRKRDFKELSFMSLYWNYKTKLNVVLGGSLDSVVGYLTGTSSAVWKWKH
jgi:hypothetical protein